MRPFSWGLGRDPSSHPRPASPPPPPDSVSPAPSPGKPDLGPPGPGYTGSKASSPYRLPGASRSASTQLRAARRWGDYSGQWAQKGARESGHDGTRCAHLESRVCPGGQPAPATSARLCSALR